jgi:hypothetical protein
VVAPAKRRNPPESPVLTAQPPRYSSPAAPRDMSRGHWRERRFKRPQRYRRASARPTCAAEGKCLAPYAHIVVLDLVCMMVARVPRPDGTRPSDAMA